MADLLVDIGNSAIKWQSENDHFSKSYYLSFQQGFAREQLRDAFSAVTVSGEIYTSCVNEHTWKIFSSVCEELWKQQPVRVTALPSFAGMENAYAAHTDLGSDRWCAMLGAMQEVQSWGMVVDCGTAMTIDILEKKDELIFHRGGYILPGLKLMKLSLLQSTNKIDIPEGHASLMFSPGTSTRECVEHGTILSMVATIEKVFHQQVQAFMKQYNDADGVCLLTGGDAEQLSSVLSLQHQVIDDLVFQGLRVFREKQ